MPLVVEERPVIILFDGACNACSRLVCFLIVRDAPARFRFAPLQSDAARRACEEVGFQRPRTTDPETLVVIVDGRALERSDAMLAIAARMPVPWAFVRALRFVPRPIRDGIYRLFARSRYRWFGRRDLCIAPAAELRGRFLE